MPQRHYSEKELGALIQRATELQEAAEGTHDTHLSLEDIEHIATELDLDPAHLRKAALELESRVDTERGPTLWGGPFAVEQARVADGPLTDEQWEQVVQALRRFTGGTGETSTIGPAREWSRGFGDGSITIVRTGVTLRPQDDQTTIQVRHQYGGVMFVAYVLAFFGGAGVAGMTLDGGGLADLLNVTIAGASGVGGLGVVRASVSLWAARQQKRLQRLAGLVHHTFASSIPVPPVHEPTRPILDLPESEDAAEDLGQTRQRVRG
ncbi:MAG: hypothetical protein HKN04_02770 [Rhodothermaceae bacterium]|nr:hypothetical protein [Rhodothermaceae bacterium]